MLMLNGPPVPVLSQWLWPLPYLLCHVYSVIAKIAGIYFGQRENIRCLILKSFKWGKWWWWMIISLIWGSPFNQYKTTHISEGYSLCNWVSYLTEADLDNLSFGMRKRHSTHNHCCRAVNRELPGLWLMYVVCLCRCVSAYTSCGRRSVHPSWQEWASWSSSFLSTPSSPRKQRPSRSLHNTYKSPQLVLSVCGMCSCPVRWFHVQVLHF